MLDFSHWPIWATVLRRAVMLLILAAFGLHAYVQYRRCGDKLLAPERWVFIAFSLIFLFGTVVNLVAARLAIQNIKQGPFNFSSFSLLILVLYLIFAGGVARRKRL
ncbi:MAG: hypothetical protein HYX78_02710 [Armatimonadetes bacterium]|nr:hypothetical protein [Armatimonadota bacterium]